MAKQTYSTSYTVSRIPPGTTKNPPNYITPTEVKNIVVQYAQGSPEIMHKLCGIDGNYIVRAIRGHINCSREKAALIRSVQNTQPKEATPMPTTSTSTQAIPGLANLHPTMRAAVTALILEGKVASCSDCSRFFTVESPNVNKCASCINLSTTAAVVTPKPAVTKPVPKVEQKHVTCRSVTCDNTLLEGVRGRKYCSTTCKNTTASRGFRERKEAAKAKEAPKGTLAPVKEPDTPKAPEATTEPESASKDPWGDKPTTQHSGKVKGHYVTYEGAACHIKGCNGTFEFRRGTLGPFFGCTNYKDYARARGTKQCRATAMWASNVDGRTLYTVNGKALPAGPVTVASAPTDVASVVLKELREISADVRDAIGRIVELEVAVSRNYDTINAGTDLQLASSISIATLAGQVSELYKGLT